MIITGVAVCLVVLLGAGFYSTRKVRGDTGNFLLAGRSLGAPVIAVLLMSQVIDSNATLGSADLSAAFGFWAGAAMPLGIAVSVLLVGLFFAKKLRATGVVTLPEYFGQRFGRGTEITASVLTVVSFGILLAGNLVALGYLLEYFLGLNYTMAVLVIIPFVLAYTMAGGMFASVYTGMVQFGVMVVGIISLLLWVAAGPGFSSPEGLGIGNLGQLTDPAQGAAINWATIVALGLGNLVAIDLMQRVFSAKSPHAAQRACFSAATGILLLCVPLSFVALAAVSIVGDSAADAPILYVLLGQYTPQWLSILVLSGLVTASLTTISGILLSTATVLVRNIFRVGGEHAGMSSDVMKATRWAMLPMAALGAIVALRVPQTGILLTLTFDLLLASLVVPFILGLFWTRGDGVAVAAAAVAGIGVRVGFFVLTPTIYGVDNTLLYIPNDLVTADVDGWTTFLAVIVSLLVYVGVAMVRRRMPHPAPDPTVPVTEPVKVPLSV
ncbi:sodium:solute symporter [Rhodococcus sp. HNM0563]|uniref:sodium:solute symporter family protein n=1 Tax=unclassified Rhodococcus (in: high G+C Gram-positive bacteria) TaxID=192944 RepID=UPI00146CAF44|nr:MULTISPECIES: sodium:solute symporter family protein [unclassified Rhodococcus (in: high G+C Gram-positive bacteria)]MCK0089987.1 sodium:solute symporter family protein [Rhodococcus sp. F64268]NLU62027.1 sodium:solute symporter [Rhodococcus sp. HNM0563]